MKKHHIVKDVVFDNGSMTMVIDGVLYKVELKKVSMKLARAGMAQREVFDISPAGYGIRWPMLDEDLSVDGLLSHVRVKRRLPLSSVEGFERPAQVPLEKDRKRAVL